MTKYKSLLSNIFIFAIGNIGSKIILFFLVPLYTNTLTTIEYGLADLVFTIGQLILPFISLTIFDALLRFGLSPKYKKEEVLKCANIVFVCGSFLMVMITPLFRLYSSISQMEWYICVYVITSFALNNSLIYLKVCDKNKLYASISIIQSFLLVLFNILFLVILKIGIKGYLLSTILSTGTSAILAFIFGKMFKAIKSAKFNLELLKQMIAFSTPLIINNVSWWFIHSSDKVMIEFILNASLLGLYSAAAKIPSLINVVTSIFSQAWGLSSIKEYDTTNEKSFYSKVFRYYLIFIFAAFIGITTFIKPFMRIYVGQSFYEAWKYVPVLLLAAVFSGFSSFLGSIYSAVQKSKNVMKTTFIAGIVNIVVNCTLIPTIGVFGAAIGTLLSYITIVIIRMKDIKKYINIDYSLDIFIPVSFISLIQCVLVTLNINVYIVSILCALIYSIICMNEMKELLNYLLKYKNN